MRPIISIITALVMSGASATADDAKQPLSTEQCILVLNGLNALGWAGQQLGEDAKQKPADAKQYKLGEARYTIALDIARLTDVMVAYQRGVQAALRELPAVPQQEPGKAKTPEAISIEAENNKRAVDIQTKALSKPCDVTPGRLKMTELKIGDGADQNQFPVSVLAAFSLIVDQDK